MNISDDYLIECIERALGALEKIAAGEPAKNKPKLNDQWPPREISVGVELARIVGDALKCDGELHALWYLEQLAGVLDVPVNERRGIAP